MTTCQTGTRLCLRSTYNFFMGPSLDGGRKYKERKRKCRKKVKSIESTRERYIREQEEGGVTREVQEKRNERKKKKKKR